MILLCFFSVVDGVENAAVVVSVVGGGASVGVCWLFLMRCVELALVGAKLRARVCVFNRPLLS